MALNHPNYWVTPPHPAQRDKGRKIHDFIPLILSKYDPKMLQTFKYSNSKLINWLKNWPYNVEFVINSGGVDAVDVAMWNQPNKPRHPDSNTFKKARKFTREHHYKPNNIFTTTITLFKSVSELSYDINVYLNCFITDLLMLFFLEGGLFDYGFLWRRINH